MCSVYVHVGNVFVIYVIELYIPQGNKAWFKMRFKKVDQTGVGKGKNTVREFRWSSYEEKIGYQAKQQARAGSR